MPSTPEALARQSRYREHPRPYLSKHTCSSESVSILLNPAARVFGLALQSQAEGILPTPLALGAESEPYLAAHHDDLRVGRRLLRISYIIFMRAEIRA